MATRMAATTDTNRRTARLPQAPQALKESLHRCNCGLLTELPTVHKMGGQK